MDQPPGLLDDGLDHPRVRMANVHDADTGGEVEVGPPVDIGHHGALGGGRESLDGGGHPAGHESIAIRLKSRRPYPPLRHGSTSVSKTAYHDGGKEGWS